MEIDDVSSDETEMSDPEFGKNVSKVVELLRLLPKGGKTQLKHFCAYICWRVQVKAYADIYPTNKNDFCASNTKLYQKWLLKECAFDINTVQKCIKGGCALAWRNLVKQCREEETFQKMLEYLPMFTPWLENADSRKGKYFINKFSKEKAIDEDKETKEDSANSTDFANDEGKKTNKQSGDEGLDKQQSEDAVEPKV